MIENIYSSRENLTLFQEDYFLKLHLAIRWPKKREKNQKLLVLILVF